MTFGAFLSLAWQSVTAPREVAQLLLSLRLRGEALWTALALVVVLNTLVFALAARLTPTPDALAPLAVSPILFCFSLGVSVLGTIAGLTLVGRGMGGQAEFADMAILVTWAQALRFLVQVFITLLNPVSPALSGLVVMLAFGAGLWIMINFVDAAHGFGSLAKSAVVLVLAVVAMVVALSLLLQLLGVTQMDLVGYV